MPSAPSLRFYRDPLSPRSHTFLVPSLGAEGLVTLHDRLYAGTLRRHRRHDIPYAPHVTVGQNVEHAVCVAQAETLNARGLAIGAVVESLDVVEIDGACVVSRERLSLGPQPVGLSGLGDLLEMAGRLGAPVTVRIELVDTREQTARFFRSLETCELDAQVYPRCDQPVSA